MYIPELLDLSYHRIHRRIPHNLKGISSIGCWIILIGCRKDEYWKAGAWIFPTFLVLKNGNLWRLLRRICKQTILYLQSTPNTPYMPDTLNTPNTSNSDTDTPLPPDTAVSSFSGSGISWFENRLFPNRHCDLLIASLVSEWSSRETEMRFGVCALMGESIFNFLIRWLPEQSINGDVETPIDGHK